MSQKAERWLEWTVRGVAVATLAAVVSVAGKVDGVSDRLIVIETIGRQNIGDHDRLVKLGVRVDNLEDKIK